MLFINNAEAKRKVYASDTACKAAIFSDSTKVKRLYGKNVHVKILPASTTKIMTAILALEKLSVNKYITVPKNATYVQPSKLYLKAREQYKVKDLLYAILINSANDASIVLATAIAGSEDKFVSLMNKRAKQIGAKQTRFANSNGLPSKGRVQYTTAYDMYLIFRHALKYPFFKNAIRLKYKTIYSRAGRKISLKNHNKILFKNWKSPICGKTGWTKSARGCFVGTIPKGNSDLIIGVFGCSKTRWRDIKHIVEKYGNIDL